MSESALLWLALNLISIVILAFYSMMEMACVSFNRVRLNYYVSKGDRRAILLNELLHNPSKLFGTTLIGVNVTMVFGSEFAREFHSAVGLNPDLAPLSQVLLVVIFGELAPMFAARTYSEHIAMLGIPLLYTSAQIMSPILWLLEKITQFFTFSIDQKKAKAVLYLTQEELQKILEEHEEEQPYASDREQFNAITSSIFSLRHKEASEIMTPISKIPVLSGGATIQQARKLFMEQGIEYVPIYHNERTHIIGIALPRDLIRAQDSRKVRDYCRQPWFVTQHAKLTHILRQFRSNKQEVALILDSQGYAVGLITLDNLVEEIFGKAGFLMPPGQTSKSGKRFIIDRSFPASMTVGEFYKQFHLLLDENRDLTLAELMEKHLGGYPTAGDSVYLDPLELSVKESSLHSVKTITVKTKIS